MLNVKFKDIIKVTSSLLIWLNEDFISNYGCAKPKIETKKVCHL